jgi:probable AcnD-accessory protein PrpF
MTQLRIPAAYMRGGTSKGVFFVRADLPPAAREPGPARDALMLRVIGSPDAYAKHTDGMGAATSSTSKVAILDKSGRPGCDVDYLFGAVAIEDPVVDWSGNCGNLSAAVGPFAIARGLLAAPADGIAEVHIWQANIGKKIIAHVPMNRGAVEETGDFVLDGVAFPAAEVRLEFLDPGAGEGKQDGAMFPTGRVVDALEAPGVGTLRATLINAGIASIFVEARALGLTGTELQGDVNTNPALLARCEAIRARGAVAMGLAASPEDATAKRPHTPKLFFVAPPAPYTASSGRVVGAQDIDLLARALSMGKLHHAMMGTGAVALAAAASIPGTVVYEAAGGARRGTLRFGHPSGTLSVGADAERRGDAWTVTRVVVSRSARTLMEGWVRVPE